MTLGACTRRAIVAQWSIATDDDPGVRWVLIELLFQLAVLLIGYLIGASAILFGARMVAGAFEANAAAFLVLTMPIACTLIAEAHSQLWRHTPGSLGLGGLVAFLPMLVAGAGIGVAIVVAQQVMPSFRPHISRDTDYLSTWLILAMAGSAVALGLWRYWPEPRARLF
jgi:hypothetical protein